MAYHTKKQGCDVFLKKKSIRQSKCVICGERIEIGVERYVTMSNIPVCCDCYKAWEEEGGKLGDISRAK